MIINHNISALNAWRQTTQTDFQLSKSTEKLTSGLRINRASDDAAGLAISEKMRGQISGLNMAVKNSQDAISLIQTAEGAMNETHSMLQRLRELAVQSANDTNTNADRQTLQNEATELSNEINRISSSTQFNTKILLDGTFAASGSQIIVQTGANAGNTIAINIASMDCAAIGLSVIDIASQAGAANTISLIDQAIGYVANQRSTLGAIQNRLEHVVSNQGVAAENLQAAESRIRDTDMALEMTKFTKLQILMQSGTAMEAQANMKTQYVLKLLG